MLRIARLTEPQRAAERRAKRRLNVLENLIGLGNFASFWTDLTGFDRFLEGSLTGFCGFLRGFKGHQAVWGVGRLVLEWKGMEMAWGRSRRGLTASRPWGPRRISFHLAS